MNLRLLYLPSAILAVALVFYFGNFNNGLSNDQSVWGAFGDFLGGILNPVLTFTTVYLLIRSLEAQRQTLSHSEQQLSEAKNTFELQQKTEQIKQFESLFFVFTEIASRTYSNFSVVCDNSRAAYGHEAVTYITTRIVESLNRKDNSTAVFDRIDDDNHNSVYGVVQSYCSLFKIIDEFCPDNEKEKYTAVAVSLIPSKAIHLMCIAEINTRWPVLIPARKLGFFSKPAMAEFINNLNSLK